MFLQIPLESERFLIVFALERFDFVVNSLGMFLQLTLRGKLFRAPITLVRSVVKMIGCHVLLHVATVQECLVARDALMCTLFEMNTPHVPI